MRTRDCFWDLNIVDALPSSANELHNLLVVDIYQNGNPIIITGGKTGLYWYDITHHDKGVIDSEGFFHVGIDAADIDKDGIKEIYVSKQDENTGNFQIVKFVPGKSLHDPFTCVMVDERCKGNPHDLIFVDIDNDSELEMITVAAYTKTPGLFIYKFDKDFVAKRFQIMEGHLTEGIKVADLDGDGNLEIISGPDYYHMPESGCYEGDWERKVYAKDFRDMCRMVVADITGNGKPDIVTVESEYRDGQFSWFENRIGEEENCFIEHRIDDCMVFAHSIQVVKDGDKEVKIFLAEMCEGGWQQPYNHDARTMMYSTKDKGNSWHSEMVYYGQGSHQGVLFDIDNDGELEIVTKTWQYPMIHILKKQAMRNSLLDLKHTFIDRDKSGESFAVFLANLEVDTEKYMICGSSWYSHEGAKRKLPNVLQALCALDIDGDGVEEIIAISTDNDHVISLKVESIIENKWTVQELGSMGKKNIFAVATIANSKEHTAAMAITYIKEKGSEHIPELWTFYNTMKCHVNTIGNIPLEGQPVWIDNNDGPSEIVIANYRFNISDRNNIQGYMYSKNSLIKSGCFADIDGDGEKELLAGSVGNEKELGRLAFYKWGIHGKMLHEHIIDTIRNPYFVSAIDIDVDGNVEIIAGEHDDIQPYRTRCKLFVYKKEMGNNLWNRVCLDDRFEHYIGSLTGVLKTGKPVIVCHGKTDKQFVNMWK